jgi:hypothetical protein
MTATMKPKLILKSLADLPANALSVAASAPGRAMNASQQAVRATRREIREARRRSVAFTRDIYARASAPFHSIAPWSRGGLNE